MTAHLHGAGRPPLRVLMSNNYDMTRERAIVVASGGDVPTHHAWGVIELEQSGHEVTVVPMSDRGFLRDVIGRIRVLGDPGQQLHVWRRRRAHDVLYCANQNPQLVIALLRRSRLSGLPMVSVLHRSFGREPGGRGFARHVLAGYDQLLCLSEPIRATMAAKHPMLADRLSFLPWGPDLLRYDRAPRHEAPPRDHGEPEAPVFVTAGKTRRDIDVLLRAFARLTIRLEVHFGADHPHAALWRAAGPGARPPNVSLHERAFEWRHIKAINTRARAVLVPLQLPLCDRYANAVGITSLMDAMAAARPVIVTRTTTPVIDVEREGIGLFVDRNDPDEWARAVTLLADDADLATRMGMQGRRLCERRYNMEAFSRGLEEALMRAAVRTGEHATQRRSRAAT